MTYAKLILPYNPTDNEVSVNPKEKQSLKGKLKSAIKKAGSAVKNAVQKPRKMLKNSRKKVAFSLKISCI